MADRLSAHSRVAQVVQENDAVLTVFAKDAADSPAAIELVHWIRGTAVPEATPPGGPEIVVGGLTAQTVDVVDEVDRATPWVLAAVLGLSFVPLLLAFRSLPLPLSAIVMNLLSVGPRSACSPGSFRTAPARRCWTSPAAAPSRPTCRCSPSSSCSACPWTTRSSSSPA
ncbi:MMPL family transporter [Actinomadura bangladeshensis]|uniref:MMPL family transporter n=1 Tax=Actinomadura bangladeshensis TaxID=453573 RepID=A0A6L9QEG8_9ACTN|nr:MMPL family transporter [Actinomadura bangladeshensis]NEA23859.1 MMPL family transporter [Actinomadura bangladeshensis]